MPTIEEITVVGQREETRPGFSWWNAGKGDDIAPDYLLPTDGGGGGGGSSLAGLPALAFPPPQSAPPPPTPPRPVLKLVPKTTPPPIPEITVVAQRLSPFARGIAWIGSRANLLLGGGFLAADLLRMSSQSALDRSYADLIAGAGWPANRDSALQTKAPEVIPEITVTASRADVLRAQLGQAVILPPAPTFEPWEAPEFESIPSAPPATIPMQEPFEITQPMSPQRTKVQPQTKPQRFLLPNQNPWNFPGSEIRPGSAPQIRTGTAPRIELKPRRLTGSRPGRLRSPGTNLWNQSQLQPVPQTQQARKRCPPCKKKKDEKRKKCFKKMVYERRFERWDKTFNWTEIDCDTGREL